MSFTWFRPEGPLRTEEQVAREVHEVSLSRGLDELASVLALMGIRQESDFWCPANEADPTSLNYDHDSLSDDGRSVAYLQQQNGVAGEVPPPDQDWWGPMNCRMDLKCSVNNFLARLADDYVNVTTPAQATEFIANVQNCRADLRGAYAQHWDYCWALLRRALAQGPVTPTPPSTSGGGVSTEPVFRPDFNEFPIWTSNSQGRGGTAVDLFLLHTQEGGGGNDAALDLANYIKSTEQMPPEKQVSYHFVLSLADDGGITVIDVVPTDQASWSVLDANNRSINLCFAGSYASWSRQDWIDNAGRAIDVAAYIAARECLKAGIPTRTIFPPYSHPGGVSDHRYVTEFLGIGTHTDVGGPEGPPWTGFPWDLFDASFQKYVGLFAAPPVDPGPPPPPPVDPPDPASAPQPTDFEYEVLAQTRGRWGKLGKNKTGPNAGKNRTVVEALGLLVDKVEGTDNSASDEFSW